MNIGQECELCPFNTLAPLILCLSSLYLLIHCFCHFNLKYTMNYVSRHILVEHSASGELTSFLKKARDPVAPQRLSDSLQQNLFIAMGPHRVCSNLQESGTLGFKAYTSHYWPSEGVLIR